MATFWDQFFRFTLDRQIKGETNPVVVNENENLQILSSNFQRVGTPVTVTNKNIRLLIEDSLFNMCYSSNHGAAINVDGSSASYCESIIYRCCGYQCYIDKPLSQKNGNFVSIIVNSNQASKNFIHDSSSSHCYNPDGTIDPLV